MQYCTKCRRLCEDAVNRCPACRSQKLRPAGEEDMAFLCRCEAYEAGRLCQALDGAGIAHSLEDRGSGYFSFDSEDSPTGKELYVSAGQMEAARQLAAQVGRELEQEQQEQEGEPPSAKRLVGEILSVLVFLLLIMAAVYGADGLANWLKSLVGGG